jgi:hypothetical protein
LLALCWWEGEGAVFLWDCWKRMRGKGGGCPGLALQERELSLVAGCWREEENQKPRGRGLELAAGIGSKGRNLQKLGENAGFLADFGPESLSSQVFNRDSIYRQCSVRGLYCLRCGKITAFDSVGKHLNHWLKVCTSSCQIWQLQAVNCPRWPLRANEQTCL